MKNTRQIQRAVNDYLVSTGNSAASLAVILGLSNATTARWANGQAKEISNKLWAKLYPHIKPFLPPDFDKAPLEITPLERLEAAIDEYPISKENKREALRYIRELELNEKYGPPMEKEDIRDEYPTMKAKEKLA
ncbi:MAG: hypothetical protein A2017_18105 [Lentisphaerae bacterium GWF2_44_16]|nr:MAG: hypothetical protein A2017_18105 [Lentisphaerae bacterium GWF2_44_16]